MFNVEHDAYKYTFEHVMRPAFRYIGQRINFFSNAIWIYNDRSSTRAHSLSLFLSNFIFHFLHNFRRMMSKLFSNCLFSELSDSGTGTYTYLPYKMVDRLELCNTLC